MMFYVKFMDKDLRVYDSHFHMGLNVYSGVFNFCPDLSDGGICYTTPELMDLHMGYGPIMAVLSVPDDALTVKMIDGTYKSSSVYIHRVHIFDEWLTDRLLDGDLKDMISCPILYVRMEPDTSEEIKNMAIDFSEKAIRYIKNPSEEIQLKAVQVDGTLIRYIEYPTERVQLTAVSENLFALKYIKNPTPDLIPKVEEIKNRRRCDYASLVL